MIKALVLFLFSLNRAHAFLPAPPFCPGDKWLKTSITAQIPKPIASYFTKDKSDEDYYLIANSSPTPVYQLSTEPGLCQAVLGACDESSLDSKKKKRLESHLRAKSGKIRITQLVQKEAYKFDKDSLSWQSNIVQGFDGSDGHPVQYVHQNIQVSALDILQGVKPKTKYAWQSPAQTAYYAEGMGRPSNLKIPPDIKYSLFFEKQNKEYEVIFTLHYSLNESYNPGKPSFAGSCDQRKIDCNLVEGDDWFNSSVEIDQKLLLPGIKVEYKKFDIRGFEEPRYDKISILNSSNKELITTRILNPPRGYHYFRNGDEKFFKDFVSQYGVAPLEKIIENKVYSYSSTHFGAPDWRLTPEKMSTEEAAIIFDIKPLKKIGDDRPNNLTLPNPQMTQLITLYDGKVYKIPLKINYGLNESYIPDLRRQRIKICEARLKLETK